MAMYFKGGKGIKNPVDSLGNEIEEGDILTHTWFDKEDPIDYMRKTFTNMRDFTDSEILERIHEPAYIVKVNDKGILYGDGIKELEHGRKLYLHDFCFKDTKIIR
jgi:hypothetical protein